MVDALFAVAPEVLGIDEFITGCRVTNMDIYGAGVATLPRFIQCEIREYLQPVLYRGGLPTLAVGDDVSVIHLRDGNRYEVAGPSGSSGAVTGVGLPCMVSVWRDCILTPYADPDDAFTNANVAGDVILVPEGTWTLSAQHTLTNQTSIAGIGAHPELCVLQATASVGINLIQTGSSCFVFNCAISYVSAAAAVRRALYVTSTSEALLVNAFCQETGGNPRAIYCDGGRLELCTAYAVDQTTGGPIGIMLENGADAYRCEGRSLNASTGDSIGLLLTTGSNVARWCRGESQIIVGATSYGIYSDTGANTIRWCDAEGEGADIYVLDGTLNAYGGTYQSVTEIIAATFLKAEGDRIAFNEAAASPVGDASWYGTFWQDTVNNWLKLRNVDNTLWHNINSGLHEHVYQEDLTLQCDGIQTNFLTAHAFATETTMVWLNGLLLRPGFDYTEDATLDGITLAAPPWYISLSGGIYGVYDIYGDILIVSYIIAP
jgi:hypothetical protein